MPLYKKESGVEVKVVAVGTGQAIRNARMGTTLNTAVGMNAYTLVYRTTWISFANKNKSEIMAENDPRFFNQYGVNYGEP